MGKQISRNTQGYAFKHFLATVFGTTEEKRNCDFGPAGYWEDIPGQENVMAARSNPSFIQRMNRHKTAAGEYTTEARCYCFPLQHDMSDISAGNIPPNAEARKTHYLLFVTFAHFKVDI